MNSKRLSRFSPISLLRQARAFARARRDAPTGVSREVRRVFRAVQERRLTYLSPSRLRSLIGLCRALEERSEPGMIVEAGCALGGSAIVLCATKRPARPIKVYDVFAMIPPPGERDGSDVHDRYRVIKEGRSEGLGGDLYYGYQRDLLDVVAGNFSELGYPIAEHSVQLVRGLVQDTLEVDAPVVLAHIDVDWYDPVTTCLERIVPRLTPHGVIVIDDYGDWSGCRQAVDDYFAAIGRNAFVFDSSPGHLIVHRADAAGR
jgi:O-methyltransferase